MPAITDTRIRRPARAQARAKPIEQVCIDTIRTLVTDAVQQANSRHADVAGALGAID